jgi:hypothetical protein
MGFADLKNLLKEHGFELQKPSLPPPKLAAERTIGERHYQYFGDGQLYYKDAVEFAQSQEYNGIKGRLLSIQCQAQDVCYYYSYCYSYLLSLSN